MWKVLRTQYIIILSFVIPILLGILFYYVQTKTILEEMAAEKLKLERTHLAMEIDDYFHNIVATLDLLELYINNNPTDEALLDFLLSIYENNNQLASLYYAKPDRSMVNVTGFTGGPGFEMESRPWYMLSVASSDVIYTPAFLNASQDRIIITMAKSIWEEDSLKGIIAADVDIQTISSLVANFNVGETGYSFLLDQNNQLIGDSNYTSGVLTLPTDHSYTLFTSFYGETGLTQEVVQGEEGMLSYIPIANNTWQLYLFLPIAEYLAYATVLLALLIGAVSIVLILLVFVFIGQQFVIVRPLIQLEKDIAAIDLETDVTYRIPKAKKDRFNMIRSVLNRSLDTSEIFFKRLKNQMTELEYLAAHDKLTGLKNRRTFDDIHKKMNKEELLPVGYIVLDVDGLKLINDTLGHNIGDEVLKTVARLLRRTFPKDAELFRMSGDEFCVLIPNTTDQIIEQKLKQLSKDIRTYQFQGIFLSLSFGYSTKTILEQPWKEVQEIAENFMYKRKLTESHSMHSKSIQTILSTLHEKNPREEAHSKRVAAISQKIAKIIGLSQDKVNELRTAGLMHDIGKIGVGEEILNKTGSLTEEEWNAIRRHPEIGYRILLAGHGLSDIANYVLSHHERYDGTGYPRGIKGDDIPIQSRILAVADAFDAMISYRSYKTLLTKQEAMEELKKNKGTQFDPQIVDAFEEIFEEIE